MAKIDWICRTKCFWLDRSWDPGNTFTPPSEPEKGWELSGGFWHPVGSNVHNTGDPLFIPVHFEPTNFKVLADVKDVLKARNVVHVPSKWKPKEDMVKDLDELQMPEPLTASDLKALELDPNHLRDLKLKPVNKDQEEAPVKKGPFGRPIKTP